MRPAGEVRLALLKALKGRREPCTSRELAACAQVGMSVASKTLDNLVAARQVVKGEPKRVAGVKRPVPTYQIYSTQLLVQMPLWLGGEVRQ